MNTPRIDSRRESARVRSPIIVNQLGADVRASLVGHWSRPLIIDHPEGRAPWIEAAAWWYIAMDNAARAQLLAEAAGTPKPIRHEIAKLTASQVGTHKGGYFSFQPLWDWITEAEPDLFN